MSNHIIDAADALVTQINAGTFTQSFTAARKFRVDELLETAAAGLSVVVVPVTRGMEVLNRSIYQQTIGLQVGVLVAFTTEPSLATVDLYMETADELIDNARDNRQLTWSGGSATLQTIEHAPIWSAQHLEELNAFLSLITLSYAGQL